MPIEKAPNPKISSGFPQVKQACCVVATLLWLSGDSAAEDERGAVNLPDRPSFGRGGLPLNALLPVLL